MFLIGIIMIYYAYGTINIQAIKGVVGTHSDTNTIKLAYVFMLSGISVKAALFPVFTWLPKAHGVAQSTISMIERGERLPSWDLAIELTLFFGVSLDELIRSGEPVNA